MLTNIKRPPRHQPHPPHPPAHITKASELRRMLEDAGLEVGPDPGKDGDWECICDVDGALYHLLAFGEKVKAYRTRGYLETGRMVYSDGSKLIIEPSSRTRFS